MQKVQTFGLSSVFLFSRPADASPQEVELLPIDLPAQLASEAEAALAETPAAMQPGLSAAQIAELEDLEKAWEDVRRSSDTAEVDEQRAFWYTHNDVGINHFYVAPAVPRWENIDARPGVHQMLV